MRGSRLRAVLARGAMVLACGCGTTGGGGVRSFGTAATASSASDTSGGETRGAAFSLSFERPDGTRRDLRDERGRAVLIVAARMDDLRTQAYVRILERIARAHPDDLTVFVLLGDEHPRRHFGVMAEAYASVVELRQAVVVLADETIRNGDSPLGRIDHVPTTFLINRAGLIARRVEGLLNDSQAEDLVRPALPPRGSAPPRAASTTDAGGAAEQADAAGADSD